MATKSMDLGQVMGTSAYQEAQAGGYTGTKEEFQKELAAVGNGGETFVIQANANVSTSGITISNVDKTLDEVNAARQEGKAIRLKLIIDSGAYQEFPLLGFFQISEKFIYGFGGADASNAAAVELTFEGDSVSAVAVDKKFFSLSDNDPAAPGTASAGTSDAAARADHVHPKEVSDADRATWNGSVRYDAAQSLTDTQKAQARTNINAAPGGFGLGEVNPDSAENNDANTITKTGWYMASINTPTSAWWIIHAITYNSTMYQFAYANEAASSVLIGSVLQRSKKAANVDWTPWGWVNPPMHLGIEYRTTERYLTDPVYVKLINLGAMPSAGGTKKISVSDLGIRVPISMDLTWGNAASENFVINNYAPYVASAGFDNANIDIVGGPEADTVHYTIYALLKYSKNT